MTQQLRVTRKVDFSGAVKVGVGDPLTRGKVLYVDSADWGKGNDGYEGTDPNYPLAKIQTAINKCTADNNDYIFCVNSYDNDLTTILVNKSSLHIIGLGTWNPRGPWCWVKIAGTGAAPAFTFVQNDGVSSELAGFTLGADTSHPCITTAVGTGVQLSYCHLHDLSFADSTDAAFLAQDGITPIDGAVMMCALIEDCTFGDQLTRDGIRFKSMTKAMIRRCYFNRVGGVGVNSITGGGADGMPDVIDCRFHGARSASAGWAISTVSAGNGYIDGNHASSTFDTNGSNPYNDTADLNEWGLNYSWDAVCPPGTT